MESFRVSSWGVKRMGIFTAVCLVAPVEERNARSRSTMVLPRQRMTMRGSFVTVATW